MQLCPEGLARADALGLFFNCKDRDSFEDCLRENDVSPSREKRALVRQQLAETKHAKTDQPFVIQCLAMLSNSKETEGLLIALLGANFVLLFFALGMLQQPASILDRYADWQ